MERRRVVITGLGAVTPVGLTAPQSWAAVCQGVCGIAPITAYDASQRMVKLAAEVKGFTPPEVPGITNIRRLGRFTQFALTAAQEAMADAGFIPGEGERIRCGVTAVSYTHLAQNAAGPGELHRVERRISGRRSPCLPRLW